MIKKKSKKKYKLKGLIFIVITLYIYIQTLNLLEKINLDIKNEDFYKMLINNSSSLSSDTILNYEKIKEVIAFKPNQLLSNNLVYEEDSLSPVHNEIKDNNKEDKANNNQEEIKNEESKENQTNQSPIVYIYNTHQTENYNNDYLADYSITPNVMIASYMLKENLEEYGIYSYVEEDSVKDVLNKNNWKYSKSYKVSRSFIDKRNKEISTFKYYIDLHRDSVKRKHTTIEINGISYARVMLLIGLEHDNYKENLKEAEKINNKINKAYPGLSRGIYKKSGSGVNGIYNQDYSKYVFLFEIGGVENNISEVNNTITVLSKILSEYIKEEGA